MNYVQKMATEELELHLEHFPKEESQVELGLRVTCISDTVVVFTTVRPMDWTPYANLAEATPEQNAELRALKDAEWLLRSFACLKLASMIAARAIGAGAVDKPEFNYRGAITVGDFAVDTESSFFLGPAVDDCADAYERAQGAFVMLTSPALEFVEKAQVARELVETTAAKIEKPLETLFGEVLDIPELVRYSVPCKHDDGSIREFPTLVVNPLSKWSPDSWIDRAGALLSFFTPGDQSVEKKRDATKKFLEQVIGKELEGA